MEASSSGVTLSIARRFAGPRARVFGAFTDPEVLRRWWGPRGFSAPSLEVDPRPGGRYRIAMRPPEGDEFHVTGTYLAVAPPARLEFTFRWEEPDPDDRETVVTVSLDEADGSTLLTIGQSPFVTEARRELHRHGWSDSLDRLGDVLVGEG